jgi:dihydroorotate dehydrogenase
VGNPSPRVVRRPDTEAIVNAMGLPNPGAEVAADRLGRTPRTGPRFASLADESIDDAVAVAGLLAPHVDGLELNASCPNVSWGRDRDTEEHLRDLVRALTTSLERPLFVKLPPLAPGDDLDPVLALASIAVGSGAAGLVCGNTLPVDEPGLAVGRGGLSGRPLLPGTLRVVSAVRAAVGPDVAIQASGGVGTGDDLRSCLEAGANVVQVYSSLIYRGPRVVRDLCRAVPVPGRGTVPAGDLG